MVTLLTLFITNTISVFSMLATNQKALKNSLVNLRSFQSHVNSRLPWDLIQAYNVPMTMTNLCLVDFPFHSSCWNTIYIDNFKIIISTLSYCTLRGDMLQPKLTVCYSLPQVDYIWFRQLFVLYRLPPSATILQGLD